MGGMNPTPNTTSPRRFDALEVSLELISQLRNTHGIIRQHDSDLAKQIRRAASSIALNLGEGERRRGRDRTHCFRIAAGSARETQVALRVAIAWGIVDRAGCQDAVELLDRILAMTWKLTER